MAEIVDDSANYPYAKEAKEQFEKVGKDWAPGDLMQSAYGIDTPIACETYIQYIYQPTIDESKLTEEQKREFKLPFFVEFDIYIGVNPDSVFQQFKEAQLEKGSDNFKEWPRGYPNKNDYEFVSHCGVNKEETEVVFTQGKNKWTLVRVGASSKDEPLTTYADGAWQVVHGMGLCN